MTTLLITGSRDASFVMMRKAWQAVERARELGWSIVVGDASGIDKEVIAACCHWLVPFRFFGIYPKPRHFCCDKHLWCYTQVIGNYYKRDDYMVDLPEVDRVLAIWNGVSGGTRHTFEYAQRQGKQVDILSFGER